MIKVSANGRTPYKNVLHHGFVVDGNGCKMSKSVGNVISPSVIVDGGQGFSQRGIDGLRYWACSSVSANQVSIGKEILGKFYLQLHNG